MHFNILQCMGHHLCGYDGFVHIMMTNYGIYLPLTPFCGGFITLIILNKILTVNSFRFDHYLLLIRML
jgi:hypothetical protein